MAKKRSKKLIAALICKDEALYFVRLKGEQMLSLPLVNATGICLKRALVKGLRNAYGLEAYIIRKLPQIVAYEGKKGTLIDVFLIDADFSNLNGTCEFVPLEEDDIRVKGVDYISAAVAKRGFIFLPFYTQRMRTIPLLEADQEKVFWERECLRYFRGKKVPRAEVAEFEGLIDSASSMRRINEAFAMICNRYGADPNVYLRYLDYREQRREALK